MGSLALFVLLTLLYLANCQNIITTIAGSSTSGSYTGDNGPATSATLNGPSAVCLDSTGNVYIADQSNNRILKVTVSTGIITSIVGTGSSDYSGDNDAATSTTLYNPIGITIDSSGFLYISDSNNHRVRKVKEGFITTIAGTGTNSYSGDNGQASSAALNYPSGVGVDASGNVYISDQFNNRIRKVTGSTGIITTVVGTGTQSYSGDNGQATAATLFFPVGVSLDASGNIYVADYFNYRIRKVTVLTGIITTIAGSSISSFSGDNGPATSAGLFPIGITVDSSGNVYVADTANHRIRKVTISTGIITTVAGIGTGSYSGDGSSATSATLNDPFGVAVDTSGNLYIADQTNGRVRKVTVTSNPTASPTLSPTADIITTVAGNGGTGTYFGDSGAATSALLHAPFSVALDTSGNLYIADTYNNRIRKVTVSTGIITTIAGTGTQSYSGDNGQATAATLNNLYAIVLDLSLNIFIADSGNHRLRKITASTGIITSIAGCETSGKYGGDGGQATSAFLNFPSGIALDSSGNVLFTDQSNNRVRKVTVSTGIITLIAGSRTSGSYSGDGGQATSAGLNFPLGIALDSSGNIYIAEYGNNCIRKVTMSTTIITTIAGIGVGGYVLDGIAATTANLYYPSGVCVDTAGNVYIADAYNNRVRKVTASTGIITTIAGTGASSVFSGDNGAATSAKLWNPSGVTLDASGNVYIADQYNYRIRKVTVSTASPSLSPTNTMTPSTAKPSTYPSESPSTLFIITTIAGSSTSVSYTGDNGAATSAGMNYPEGVAIDSSGNVYIADSSNHCIRKVTVSTGIITTFAGTGSATYSGDGVAATSAALNTPRGVSIDASGNIYIADDGNNRIRKVTAGIMTTVAGIGPVGTGSFSGDGGQAIAAGLCYPYGVTVDSAGNIYIADTFNHRIRKVTVSTGIINTIAGTGTSSYSGDYGQATSAVLNYPQDVAVDSAGNIYIADTYNHRIRKVTVSTGIITTIAGTGTASYSGDNGLATSATFNYPRRLALDAVGNVYIADNSNHRIRKVTISTGLVDTIAGTGSGSYSGDNGQATSATLDYPWGVALDSKGNVYIADTNNNRIRKVTTTTVSPTKFPTRSPSTSRPSTYPSLSPSTLFIITTIAGTGTASYSGDSGAATAAGMYYPQGVALDSSGNVYIGDMSNHRIRKVTVSTGIITTFAGTGSASYSGDNEPATSLALNFPSGVALDASGNVYIGDQNNHRIRKVTVSTGILTTIAGTGGSTYNGDVIQATSATLKYPLGVALDSAGNVYIADNGNSRIRKVTVSTGLITTIAGTGTGGYSGDNGPATSAAISTPYIISVDSAGNVYIPELSNHRIRKVTVSTGIITTIAGTGTDNYSGDNGPATSAALSFPQGVFVDATGNIYIADGCNHRIRKVTVSTGIITTIAGTGTASYSGDGGAATAATLYWPMGVAVDASGNVYIGDQNNNRIRKVTVGGTYGPSAQPTPAPTLIPTSSSAPSLSPSIGIITTVVGTGTASYSGDSGAATSATINNPQLIAVDASGNIYIADFNNNRVRKVTISTGIIITLAGTGSASYSGDGGQATSAALNNPNGIALDSSGNVYVTDFYNNRLRKVTVSTGIISTFAGTGTTGYNCDSCAATSSNLYTPMGVALDSTDNVYIADYSNRRIRKVTVPSNIITTVAGTGIAGYTGDGGQATAAGLTFPFGVALDSVGNFYISDTTNHCVRKVTVSTGIITTFAGTGTLDYSGDNGPATSATLNYPFGITVDTSGNVYIADRYNHRIRKVTISTGIITTIAGNGGTGSFSGDGGAATAANLNIPQGVCIDATGTMYISDSANNRIRKMSIVIPSMVPTLAPSTASIGIITTIAGSSSTGYSGDNGAATSAGLNNPYGVALDSPGNVYIADQYNNRIRKVTISTGIITTIAGSGGTSGSYSGDNDQATSATLYWPSGVALDASGNVYIGDWGNNRVRKVTVSSGIISTIAGKGTNDFSGDGGQATSAELNKPYGVALDSSGNVYIADTNNNRIRKVTVSTGVITTIAGGTSAGFGDNGPATSAALSNPTGVAVDSTGNVYIADYLNYCIRKVTVSTGIISTYAGIGIGTYSGDNGPATIATVNKPIGVSVDAAGNVYIADTSNNRIRKVTASTGIITTIAGGGESTCSFSGDGSQATSAGLCFPSGVTVDLAGNVYIADTFNYRVRKVASSTPTSSPSFIPSASPTSVTPRPSVSPTCVPSTSTPSTSTPSSSNPSTASPTVTPTTIQPSPQPSTSRPSSSNPTLSPSSAFIITTLAGTGASSYSGDSGAATSAALDQPYGVSVDSAGNVYIADYNNHRIRKVTVSTGIITTVAGTGSTTFSGDNGQATAAALYFPSAVVLDSTGNVYIADTNNHRIRKVTASTGIITTVAGCVNNGYGGDSGAATSASLYYPSGVAVDTSGNIYIADQYNHRIRKVTVSTGIITTIAGTGSDSYSGDNGQATSATLDYPSEITVDSAGNVYIGDSFNYRVRKVTVSTGIITTIAGTGTGSYNGDNGAATSIALCYPYGLALDSSGNVYIADICNVRIRKLTVSTGLISTFAGDGLAGYDGDNGDATAASLCNPRGVVLDASGNVYIADTCNHRIRKVTISTASPSVIPTPFPSRIPSTFTPSSTFPSLSPNTDIITTIAGTGAGTYSGDNGAATNAAIYNPLGLGLDATGNVYIADTNNHRVRKVTISTGIITTVAGTGIGSYSGDNGSAIAASLQYTRGVVVDAAGNVYIADQENQRIRKVTVSTGIITTIAGSSTSGGYNGDGGAATSAVFNSPSGLSLDSAGNVYIADRGNHRIRKVTISTGIITTYAGTSSVGYSGDTGQATSAALYNPSGVAVDSTGNVYIADQWNHRVRKVTVSTNIITTVAGTGTTSYSGDNGAATAATLYYPIGVGVDTAGNVYIADQYNNRIRKVTVSTGIIATVAGTGTASYSGDNGPATAAALNSPSGVAVDATGNLYISDNSNNRIRKVTVATASPSMSPSTTPTTTPSTTSPSFAPTVQLTSSAPTSYAPTYTPTYIPSCEPTLQPSSSTPSTSAPTYTPTVSPSAYPTYSSSVSVYFTVTQGLSGISASTYSNNQESNNALFKQTVASALGYDSKKEDVTIEVVTDVVQRRSLSTVQECVVTYSIATTTLIFNDTNHATAMFMQALNESIATGVFDLILHANAGSSWQSVTTAYTIFNTASPTSSPTSTPTSAPTKTDIVAASILAIPLDSRVAKAKIKYYLGTFIGYFLAIYICLYLYSFLHYGKLTATQLYVSSYQSDVHVRSSLTASTEVVILADMNVKNELVQIKMKQQEQLTVVMQNATVKHLTDKENKFSRGYREYMQQQRVLLGCSPFIYPGGCVITIPCTCSEMVFPPGRVEDMLLYICHNHPLFSCFYFMEGSKLGAHGTRILYIGKDVAVFVLYQFSNMLLQYFMLDGHGLGTLVNLFVITPSALSIGLVLKYLYTCPFTESVEFQRKYAKYQSTILFLGRLAILPIMLIMFGSLIIACLFSSNRDTLKILINYLIFVQIYGVLFAIIKAVLLFVDNYYYRLSLFGVLDILCIGRLYKERILAEQLVVDVDYAYRINTYLCGLIKVQKILNRDDAIKAKWITAAPGGNYDVEMITDQNWRASATVSMDGIYKANEVTTANPIHTWDDYQTPTTSHQEVLHLEQSVINSKIDETFAVDDDAALYLEYQNLQEIHDDTLYDINESEDTEVTMTFEEWKTKKKQFKQGTRGSFVKAFQVFEEREKIAQDILEHSASVQNTMKLYQYGHKVKNALAVARAFGPAANKAKHSEEGNE